MVIIIHHITIYIIHHIYIYTYNPLITLYIYIIRGDSMGFDHFKAPSMSSMSPGALAAWMAWALGRSRQKWPAALVPWRRRGRCLKWMKFNMIPS